MVRRGKSKDLEQIHLWLTQVCAVWSRNETFNFDASASALTVKMYDRKTIGKDKEVGEALIEVSCEREDAGRVDLPRASPWKKMLTPTDCHHS